MDQSIKDKLLSCRSYDDAKPILETFGAGVASHELTRTAYGIQAKQPTLASQFLNSVIQEIEDDEDKKKKLEEIDGGQSEQSSSTTGLENQGTESEAAEAHRQQADKKDQMGVTINEAYPPPVPGQMPPPQQMGGGQCPQGGMPPQAPPPMPPQQQMQYTISEMVKQQLAPVREAIKALDKKIQETQRVEANSMELGASLGHKRTIPKIQETTGNAKLDLNAARLKITKMNNMISSGKY